MRFANLKIGTRLAAGGGVLMLLMAAISGVGGWGLWAYKNAASDVQSALEGSELATEWKSLLDSHSMTLRFFSETTDPAVLTELEGAIEEQSIRSRAILKEERALAPERAQKFLDSIEEAEKAFAQNRTDYITSRLNQPDQARNSSEAESPDRMWAAMKKYEQVLGVLKKRTEVVAKMTAEEAESTYELVTKALILLSISAFGVGAATGFLLTRSITRPLATAVGVASRVAEGDLTQRIDSDSFDETGALLLALGRMNVELAAAVSNIRSGADSVLSASRDIAEGNSDLSARTEQQAASLQQTAASIEELTATVAQTSDNAKSAEDIARHASEMAKLGGDSITDVTQSMEDISSSASKISDFVAVIEKIAFQTNILALNASVEAARAGENGKGFAVVAGEVQTLARGSADAAREIKLLVESSMELVGTGMVRVRKTGGEMGEIVSSVGRVTQLVREIASASAEQAKGIQEINAAMEQLDSIAQQNATLVEDAAASARVLAENAERLSTSVGSFSV